MPDKTYFSMQGKIFCSLVAGLILAFGSVNVSAQSPKDSFKSLGGEWLLDVKATRDANPPDPNNPYTKNLDDLLTKAFSMKVTGTGVVEEIGPKDSIKKACKLVLAHDGQTLFIAQHPHWSSVDVSLITLTKDRLTMSPMVVNEELAWQPAKITLVFLRK